MPILVGQIGVFGEHIGSYGLELLEDNTKLMHASAGRLVCVSWHLLNFLETDLDSRNISADVVYIHTYRQERE
jgi:hypothetical protein